MKEKEWNGSETVDHVAYAVFKVSEISLSVETWVDEK